jgi:hypothetical protein
VPPCLCVRINCTQRHGGTVIDQIFVTNTVFGVLYCIINRINMKKQPVCYMVTILLLSVVTAFPQKGIKGLVDAEKAFASFTTANTVKEGFLKYMDSTGVIFRQGKAVNAWEAYRQQQTGPAILSWEPAFAIISASGDFGVTTGPYERRSGSLQDTIVARGSFSSVWQINKQGLWKNLADLGTSYKKTYPVIKQVQQIELPVGTAAPSVSFEEVLTLDKKFNTALAEKNNAALSQWLPLDSWLNMEGEIPVVGDKLIANILAHIPATVLFETETGNISAAGDMAYIYGSVTNANKKENYLRVWIKRNNKWQVILQTIKW